MKIKFLLLLCLTICLGFLTAKSVYKLYFTEVDAYTYNSYFLQSGVYSDQDTMKKETKNLRDFIYEKKDNKYYVYIGITTDMDNANKIKKIYKNKKIDIYIKESKIDNIEFLSSLEQYDILLSEVIKDNDILSINKVILSSYEEIVLGNSK